MRETFCNMLRRVQGYAAFQARARPRQQWFGSGHRISLLAEAIAAKYSALERRWPALALIFENSGPGNVSVLKSVFNTHSTVFLNPRTMLSMRVDYRSGPQVNKVERVTMPKARHGVQPVYAMLPGARDSKPTTTETITRIVRRGVREECMINVKSGTSWTVKLREDIITSGARSAVTQDHGMMFRGNHRSRTEPAEGDHRVSTTTISPWRTNSDNEVQTPAPPAQADIARITDQVLQALDRRIVTQRERMGGL